MATDAARLELLGMDVGRWVTGAVAGAISVLLAFGVRVAFGAPGDVTTVQLLGILLMPGAIFGLIYTGIVSISSLNSYAMEPQTGILLGLIFGLLFWVTTIIGSTFTIHGLAGGLTFGLGIGFLYAVSPYVE